MRAQWAGANTPSARAPYTAKLRIITQERAHLKRRTFINACGSFLAALAVRPGLAAGSEAIKPYNRVRLVGADGNPIKAKELLVGETYLFHYPYRGTPCFLLRLDRSGAPAELSDNSGGNYRWPGGAGSDGAVVGYAAICSHQLSYASRRGSFVNYYHKESSAAAGRAGVITCCAHGSVFDPAQGAQVLGGQAQQPLTAIALQYDPGSDGLFAAGTIGPEVYDEYFKAYRVELIEEFGRGRSHDPVEGTAAVHKFSEYVSAQYRC
jgi:Rieske Fe-S protein